MKELQYLNKYFIKYKFHFFTGVIITIAAQIFALFTPELIKDSMAAVENIYKKGLPVSSIKAELNENILLIIATTRIAGILTFFMRQTIIVMSRHVEFDLQNEVFRQYERLSQNFY